MEPKYPNITVQLVGNDGNALAIVDRVKAALRQAGVESEQLKEFVAEALSGDYDNVLQTAMKWVTVK